MDAVQSNRRSYVIIKLRGIIAAFRGVGPNVAGIILGDNGIRARFRAAANDQSVGNQGSGGGLCMHSCVCISVCLCVCLCVLCVVLYDVCVHIALDVLCVW